MSLRVRVCAGVMPVLLLAQGCATGGGYWTDRRRDAEDILTFTVGSGGGVKARVGPLQVVSFNNTDLFGLRGGQWFWNGNDFVDNEERYYLLPFFGRPNYGEPVTRKVFETRRGRVSDYRTEEMVIHSPGPLTDWRGLFGREVFNQGVDTPSDWRGKSLYAAAPLPFWTTPLRSKPFYTQIELAGGILFTLRVGFNPGELLDFLVGWAGWDLYGDDLSKGRGG